jgi:hypothetical protein
MKSWQQRRQPAVHAVHARVRRCGAGGYLCSQQMAQISPSIYAQCLQAEQNQNACGRAAGCDKRNDGGAYARQGGTEGSRAAVPRAVAPDAARHRFRSQQDRATPVAGNSPVTGKYIPPALGMVEPLRRRPFQCLERRGTSGIAGVCRMIRKALVMTAAAMSGSRSSTSVQAETPSRLSD